MPGRILEHENFMLLINYNARFRAISICIKEKPHKTCAIVRQNKNSIGWDTPTIEIMGTGSIDATEAQGFRDAIDLAMAITNDIERWVKS